MNWITAIFTAVLGWFTGRQRSKTQTLQEVNEIYRKGTEARTKNDPVTDRLYNRD